MLCQVTIGVIICDSSHRKLTHPAMRSPDLGRQPVDFKRIHAPLSGLFTGYLPPSPASFQTTWPLVHQPLPCWPPDTSSPSQPLRYCACSLYWGVIPTQLAHNYTSGLSSNVTSEHQSPSRPRYPKWRTQVALGSVILLFIY